MPSHFSSIGFPVYTEEEYIRLVMHAAEAGETITVAQGTYVRWKAGHGAELWVQIDADGAIVGLHPHFVGEAVMRVSLTQRITRPDDTVLDGAFYGWADPDQHDPERGAYPFVFDTPDYGCHSEVTLPSLQTVQVAAFAHELEVYASEEAYYASQETEIKFAAESFIPAGLFNEEETEESPPAHAVFTGHVLETARLEHASHGEAFYWAYVRTLGGEIDVVADPALVELPLTAGCVVTGSFWLSGRLQADQDGTLRKVLHRLSGNRQAFA